MEQDSNLIDKQFNRRLYDAEAAPPSFVWTNIERELRKRRRRRFAFWLFAAGAAGVVFWGYLIGWGAKQQSYPATETQNTTVETDAASNSGAPGQDATVAPLPSNTSGASETTEKGSTVANFHGLTQKSAPRSGDRYALASQLEPAAAPDIETGYLVGNAGDMANADLLVSDFPLAGYLSGPASSEIAAQKAVEMATVAQTARKIPFIRKRKDAHNCYDFSQNPNVWLIDAYAGPSFSKKQLDARAPAFESYRQQRNNTESRDFSFNAGIRGSLLFGRHFLIRTGLHYEQMTEVFEYVDPNYIKYLVEITQTIIDNKPVTIIDTIGVDYGENYVKTFNRYGLLDIPVEAGIELRKGRFGLSLNGGLSLNILFWKRGTILTASGQPAPFTPGEKNAVEVYRPRTGLSVGGSAQVFFHIQPRLRVFAEPYFRQVLKPVTLDNQPVEQRYRVSGVKIGLTRILD